MAGSTTSRVRVAPVDGAATLFTPAFLDFLVPLHDQLTPRIQQLLAPFADSYPHVHRYPQVPELDGGTRSGGWDG